MVKLRTSLMFQTNLVCQLVWLSSSSFVNPKPSGDTDYVLETQQHGEDLPVRLIVATEFYEENATLVLQHEDGQKIVANLEVEDDCIFRGSMAGCTASTVLVTGCKGDLQGVQIQSRLFGDMMFTTLDGVVMHLGSKKHKRDADMDYDDYDDDVLRNPIFETQFGSLDSAEAEDLPPPPSKLELQLNVYVDKLWSGEFGRKSGPRIVRNIVEQTALLLNHKSLNTKIKLIYDEANLYTSTEHLLPDNSRSFYHEVLPQQLVGPNLTTRGEPTAHLYLTVEGDGEKSYLNGRSMINSMCGFEKPRIIVVHRDEETRTAMTVAHELGHLLGLEHDFRLGNRSKTCGGTTKEGPFVMNYGDTRQTFSECSNIDFKTYYHTVVAGKGNFCLTEGVVGCHCNGYVNSLGSGGNCTDAPDAWCYVNKDSGCKDIKKYHDQFISYSPCTFKTGRKEELKETTTGRSTVPWKPCGCNGEADVVGLGGKCGPTGWCYVDEDMLCEDMSPYNRKNISREACPATKPPCSCNGQTDFVGNGGSCQDGPKGAWCYVDGEADCDNKNPYNGNFISMSPCTGRAATSCAWSAWSSWSSCSATCGGGSQYATRSVDQQATGGGEQCEGSKKRSQQCGIKKCPTDCAWSAWSSWSSCSATCGGGSQYATRNIDQQATNGGHECKGSKKRSQECGMAKCRTDCAWSAWSSWSSCSATCGGGSQYATRQMTNQATGGGEVCEGEPVKIQQCGMNQCGYLLTSSGVAAEYKGDRLGLYDEIQHEYGGRVFKQRGAEVFIYKKDDKWWCGSTVGASKGYFKSTDLFSKPGEWHYYDGEDWQNNDPTLHFLPLPPSSCILQPSIQITSTGPALTRYPDYLGTFWIVQDVFSAGRPVWRNSKGKVLMILPGYVNFGVYDGIEETGAYIASASGPTCPTDNKAGHSDRNDVHAWRFWDVKNYAEDNTITVQ